MYHLMTNTALSRLNPDLLRHRLGVDESPKANDPSVEAEAVEKLRQFKNDVRRRYQSRVRFTTEDVRGCELCGHTMDEGEIALDETNVMASESSIDASRRYQYQPLPSPECTRLLELAPAESNEDQLEASLKTYDETEIGDYFALSYTWQGIDHTGLLHLNSGDLEITGNLDLALRALRKQDFVLRIWVDAVCIDQNNNEEKAQQVARMGKIYKQAECVLAWLGPENEVTVAAVGCLEGLAERSKADEHSRYIWSSSLSTLGHEPHEIDVYEATMIEEMRKQLHLDDILGRAWFQRLWIVQELLLAQKLVFHIGSHRFEWDHFRAAVLLLLAAQSHFPQEIYTQSPDQPHPDPLWNPIILIKARDQRQHLADGSVQITDHTPLSYMVAETFGDWGCKEERDRIYAILNLGPKDADIEVRPDYNLPVEQVYTDFARQHFIHESLMILLYSGLAMRRPEDNSGQKEAQSSNKDISKLPTWVPEVRLSKAWLNELAWRPSEFRTGFAMEPEVILNTKCPHIVSIRGAVINDIALVFQHSEVRETTPGGFFGWQESLDYCGRFAKLCQALFDTGGEYRTGDSLETVLKSLLTAGGTQIQMMGHADNPHKARGGSWLDRTWDIAYPGLIGDFITLPKEALASGEVTHDDMPAFFSAVSFLLKHHCFIVITERDPQGRLKLLFGFAPKCAKDRDRIAIVNGLTCPVVLRETPTPHRYEYVGPCYIHGMMKEGLKYERSSRSDAESAPEFIELV